MVITITLILAGLAAPFITTAGPKGAAGALQAGGKTPKIAARVKPIIRIGQLEFRDLNGDGKLDPYEDWRLPAEKRVADLISRMTMEEKAGLMQITSFNANALNDYVHNRHIRYLILRDNLTARELAARANASQEIAEKSRLGVLSMANSKFGRISLRLRFLLQCCDAPTLYAFRSCPRHNCPALWAGRHSFRGRRIRSPQTSTADLESITPASA
jgi:hypothetical protein